MALKSGYMVNTPPFAVEVEDRSLKLRKSDEEGLIYTIAPSYFKPYHIELRVRRRSVKEGIGPRQIPVLFDLKSTPPPTSNLV